MFTFALYNHLNILKMNLNIKKIQLEKLSNGNILVMVVDTWNKVSQFNVLDCTKADVTFAYDNDLLNPTGNTQSDYKQDEIWYEFSIWNWEDVWKPETFYDEIIAKYWEFNSTKEFAEGKLDYEENRAEILQHILKLQISL